MFNTRRAFPITFLLGCRVLKILWKRTEWAGMDAITCQPDVLNHTGNPCACYCGSGSYNITIQLNPNPVVFLPEASFGLRVLSSPLSVYLSVCVCINHLLVRTITHQPFKLESPNLKHRYKTPWSRWLLFWGWSTLNFKVKFNLKVEFNLILSLSAR